MSCSGWRAVTCAAARVPSANSTWILRGAVDDVQGGEHGAARVDDHAAPRRPRCPPPSARRSVVTVTSDGLIVR